MGNQRQFREEKRGGACFAWGQKIMDHCDLDVRRPSRKPQEDEQLKSRATHKFWGVANNLTIPQKTFESSKDEKKPKNHGHARREEKGETQISVWGVSPWVKKYSDVEVRISKRSQQGFAKLQENVGPVQEGWNVKYSKGGRGRHFE